MIRINLLPVKAAQKKEKLLGQCIICGISLVVVLVGCGIAHFSVLAKINHQEELKVQLQNESRSLAKTIGEVKQYEKLQLELQGKLDVLQELKNARTGPVRILDELSRALPEKLWLTEIKESGGSITVNGVGMNEENVAQLMRNLEESSTFQGVELQVIEQVSQEGQKLQKFEVSCRIEKKSTEPVVAKK